MATYNRKFIKNNQERGQRMGKVLIVVPAYNEAENIEKTITI